MQEIITISRLEGFSFFRMRFLVSKDLKIIKIGNVISRCVSDGCRYYRDHAEKNKRSILR